MGWNEPSLHRFGISLKHLQSATIESILSPNTCENIHTYVPKNIYYRREQLNSWNRKKNNIISLKTNCLLTLVPINSTWHIDLWHTCSGLKSTMASTRAKKTWKVEFKFLYCFFLCKVKEKLSLIASPAAITDS